MLALVDGYLRGVISERTLVRELTGNPVLRWFVKLDLDRAPRDDSTFSQNRKRRFTESGLLNRPFDETGALTITQKLVSPIQRWMVRRSRPMPPRSALCRWKSF